MLVVDDDCPVRFTQVNLAIHSKSDWTFGANRACVVRRRRLAAEPKCRARSRGQRSNVWKMAKIRNQGESNILGQIAENAVLAASVDAMQWRLRETAVPIDEAADALSWGDRKRALDRLLDIEPLIFEAQRILSAASLLAHETTIRATSSQQL